MGQRKTFRPEFQREAVQLLESGSRPASQMARELGIKRNQLYKWQAELKARGGGACPGSGRRQSRTDEVSRLKQELARVTEERDILKKAAAYLAKELRCRTPLFSSIGRSSVCHVLQVSRSGFYAWQGRPESSRAQHNRALTDRMRIRHQETREAYGARKMWQRLKQEEQACGRHRVARLRRVAGIMARRRQRVVRTIQARPKKVSLPNHLNRDFPVAKKNRVWAADMTYIPTRAGWLYLAVLVDLYSRRVVGWAMRERQTTT